MRMISAMLGKTKDIAKTKNMLDTWNFGVENPVDSAKLKQLFPFPLPISKFLVQKSTLLFMRWKTQHETSVSKILWIMQNGNNCYPHSQSKSKFQVQQSILLFMRWKTHNASVSKILWILLNGNNYSHFHS